MTTTTATALNATTITRSEMQQCATAAAWAARILGVTDRATVERATSRGERQVNAMRERRDGEPAAEVTEDVEDYLVSCSQRDAYAYLCEITGQRYGTGL